MSMILRNRVCFLSAALIQTNKHFTCLRIKEFAWKSDQLYLEFQPCPRPVAERRQRQTLISILMFWFIVLKVSSVYLFHLMNWTLCGDTGGDKLLSILFAVGRWYDLNLTQLLFQSLPTLQSLPPSAVSYIKTNQCLLQGEEDPVAEDKKPWKYCVIQFPFYSATEIHFLPHVFFSSIISGVEVISGKDILFVNDGTIYSVRTLRYS